MPSYMWRQHEGRISAALDLLEGLAGSLFEELLAHVEGVKW